MVGSEVNSSKVKKSEVLMETLLRAVGVHIKENKEVCEGEAKVQAQSTAQEPPAPRGEIAAPIEPVAPKKKRVKQAAKRPSHREVRSLAATKPSKRGLCMTYDSTDNEADQVDDLSKRPRKDKPTQGLPLSHGPISMDFTRSSSSPLKDDRQSPPQEGDGLKAAASHNPAAQSSTPQDQSSSHTPSIINVLGTGLHVIVNSPKGTIEQVGGSPSENVDAEIGIDKPPPKRPYCMDSTSHVFPVHSRSTMPKNKTSSPRKSKIPSPPKDNSPPPKEPTPPPPPKNSTAPQFSTHIPTLLHTLLTMQHQIIASQLQMQHALETKVSTVHSLLNDVIKGQDTLKADLQEVKDRASEVIAQGERSAAAMAQLMSRAEIIGSRIEGTEVHLAGVETLMHTIAENVEGLQKKKKFKVIVQS